MPSSQPNRPPLFMLLFISIFGFIGLLVLGALWSSDEPPLFFKLFGSLIAVAFVLFGFGFPISILTQKARTSASVLDSSHRGYKCPNCAAGLDQVEVSPSGDVKCSYCSKWFNIHRS